MTVSRKGKRRLVVGSRLYLWWVHDGCEPDDAWLLSTALMVASADRRQ